MMSFVSESDSGVVREIEEDFFCQLVLGRRESRFRGSFETEERGVRERKFCVLFWSFVL